ncbi:hypothetical protein [Vibrio scophthalmi]|uniref:Uncharacterized protein n=1 Tax=Vibrio scophthalmi TaxID=45658 RepID=A0A1E3WJ21_9VIBR|nr:hypothetical protein [Vibrio scophthalmi]ODS09763.1 hypothetical protein VSF3289_03225 [Vibrio scophthalmi]
MKKAYHYDFETLLFIAESQVFLSNGYVDYILPQFASWTILPQFDAITEQCRYREKTDDWVVESKYVAITAYHKEKKQTKCFEDISLISNEYTSLMPQTDFDKWVVDQWVTNKQDKYISDYTEVDAIRESMYRQMIDPLEGEAARKVRQGKTQEAQELWDRIDEIEAKIKADNPFPLPPQ